jgi:hypothetical protein
MQGGQSGQAIVPFDVDRSLLLRPPKQGKMHTLSQAQEKAIRVWILAGAKPSEPQAVPVSVELSDVPVDYNGAATIHYRALDEAYVTAQFQDALTGRLLATVAEPVVWPDGSFSAGSTGSPGSLESLWYYDRSNQLKRWSARVSVAYSKQPHGTLLYAGELHFPNEGGGFLLTSVDPSQLTLGVDSSVVLTTWLESPRDFELTISGIRTSKLLAKKAGRASLGLLREMVELDSSVLDQPGYYVVRLALFEPGGLDAKAQSLGVLAIPVEVLGAASK